MRSHQTISAAFANLGLPTNVTSEQANEAFRDLAQVWHPDRFAQNPRVRALAEARMTELNCAYSIVSDYLEGNRQRGDRNSEQVDHGKSTEQPESTAAHAANSAHPTGAKTSRDEHDKLTIVKCPHCGQEGRVWLSARQMSVALSVRCRQCGKRVRPDPLSDIRGPQESFPFFSGRSRSNKVPASSNCASTTVPPVNKKRKQSRRRRPFWTRILRLMAGF